MSSRLSLRLSHSNSQAAEVIPPKPAGYFNDYAGVVSKEAALRFNEQLAQFERETSDQVVVAVFPKMQSDSSIEDYTQRVAQAWGVGQKDRRNGAVLFVFKEDRKMYIQVGYGLEGALPDVTAFDITEYQIKPHFRTNDYEGGLAAGIDSICKAIRGEYKGSGKTVRERHSERNAGNRWLRVPDYLRHRDDCDSRFRTRARLSLFRFRRAIHRRMVERFGRRLVFRRRRWI